MEVELTTDDAQETPITMEASESKITLTFGTNNPIPIAVIIAKLKLLAIKITALVIADAIRDYLDFKCIHPLCDDPVNVAICRYLCPRHAF